MVINKGGIVGIAHNLFVSFVVVFPYCELPAAALRGWTKEGMGVMLFA
jgi:hypothetical protein